jgi:hypothetical protein
MSNACHHMTREDRNALIATQRRAEALTAVVRGDASRGRGRHALCGAADLSHRQDEFEKMMRALVATERTACRGDRYFPAGATAQ